MDMPKMKVSRPDPRACTHLSMVDKNLQLPKTSRRPFHFIAYAEVNNKSINSNHLGIEK